MGQNDVGELGGFDIRQDLVSHRKEFGFFSTSNEKSLKDMNREVFSKITAASKW